MRSVLAALISIATQALAQDSQPTRRNTYHSPGAAATAAAQRPISPEVHPDRTITFRMRAPKAAEVSLAFSGKTQAMTKDATGLWTITVGPVAPEIYTYNF